MPVQPIIIGIAGGTGSGKTTVARNIIRALPAQSAVHVDHDSYYKDLGHLGGQERAAVNFDHPDSLDNTLLAEHLKALKNGQVIEKPLYDFKTHRRSEQTERIEPAGVIVVEGILILADPELRALFDIKLYVDTDSDIRVFRRIRRDIEQRGRSFESIRQQYYRTVRPMHIAFVEPSKRYADIVLPEGGDNHVGLDVVVNKLLRFLENR